VTEVAGRTRPHAESGRAPFGARLRAPLGVAGARLRARPGRAALVALGVAAAAATLVAILGGSLVARDRAVQRALAGLSPAERSFRVDAFGLPGDDNYAQTDRLVRAALAPLAAGTPLRATFFRELRIDGELVQLGGIDGLDGLVRLRSGRMPRVCDAARCEVLEIGSGGRARLDEAGIHLVRVGTADVPRRAVFGSSIDTQQQGGDNPTLLITAGAKTFDGLSAYDGFYRIYSWISPLDPRRLHIWEINRVLDRETLAQTNLARAGDVFQLSGPDQALTDARSQGRVAAERMLLVGGEGSALLLGFALVAAMGLRRGLANEGRRLRQRGAGRLQVWLSAGAEITATTLAGVVVGAAAGVAAVAVVAHEAGLPGGAVITHSIVTALGLGVTAGVWLAATATVFAGSRVRDTEVRRRRVRLLDVAAVGAAAAVALGLARGGLDAQSLSSGSNTTLLLGLPILVSFVAAVAAVRLLHPLTRLAERVARKSRIELRLALLALSRAPVRTTATAAFLLVSLGLGLFAVSWRSTLQQGAGDEAAFAVPLDFSVVEGPRLVLPLEASTLAGYDALAPGTHAYPVLRRSADVAGVGTSILSPTVLGLPADAISHLRWRSDFSSDSPGELALRLGADGPVVPNGISFPKGATRAFLTVRLTGVAVHLDLIVRDADDRTYLLFLGEKGPGTWRLRAKLPRGPLQAVGLAVSLASAEQLGFSHRETGGEEAAPESGAALVEPLRASIPGKPDVTLTDWHGFVTRGGLRLTTGSRIGLTYAFTQGQTMLLRLPQPTDGKSLRVIASPDVAQSAGPGGTLTLDFQDVRVPARIVAVAKRFPNSEQEGEGFVIADEQRLATTLDAGSPGTGTPLELWLSTPYRSLDTVAAALGRPPFDSLTVSSQRDLRDMLASDPLARGISLSLAAAALAALALALAGFWVALLSELRDERGELFDLEAQGVSPGTLRRQFRLRAAGLLAAGVVGGCVLGLFLSRLVVSVVRVSGTTAPPDPPLRLDIPWEFVLLGLGLVVAGLAIVVEVATRHAFRGDVPERASWSLE
jgi:hypothetical protein